jgi:hypothetical protein
MSVSVPWNEINATKKSEAVVCVHAPAWVENTGGRNLAMGVACALMHIPTKCGQYKINSRYARNAY